MITSFQVSQKQELFSSHFGGVLSLNINATNVSLSHNNCPAPKPSRHKNNIHIPHLVTLSPIRPAEALNLLVLPVEIDSNHRSREALLADLLEQSRRDTQLISIKNRMSVQDNKILAKLGVPYYYCRLELSEYIPSSQLANRNEKINLVEFHEKIQRADSHWTAICRLYPAQVIESLYRELDLSRKGYFDLFDLFLLLTKQAQKREEKIECVLKDTRSLELIMRRLGGTRVRQYEFMSAFALGSQKEESGSMEENSC